jgi:osmoprotectant transport system permease protein
MHHSELPPRQEINAAVARWLEQNRVTVIGTLGFENAYVLAMSRRRANALGIHSIADLARHPELTIAGDYEFFGRPEWRSINAAYGFTLSNQRQMQPEFMYPAAAAGEVDVIAAYSSDGRIAQYDLEVLDDPKQAIPPYDAMLLLSPRRATDQKLIATLRPLVGAIPIELMRAANRRAGLGDASASPSAVARWMWDEIESRRARVGDGGTAPKAP